MTEFEDRIQLPGSDTWFGTDTNGGVDESFLSTFNVELLAGRNFQADNPTDQKSILISKASSKRLGFTSPEDAIGKNIIIIQSKVRSEVRVIGVIRDYEFRPYFSNVSERQRGVVLTYKNYVIPEFKPFKLTFKIDLERTQTNC